MKLALAHEYLIKMGGAEKVLLDWLEAFDNPPIFTFLLDRKGLNTKLHDKHDIYPSFLQNYPLSKKFYKYYFPWMPLAAESLDFRGFDVVLSDSHQFMKGIIVPQHTLHICYMHTATRFLWLERREPWGTRGLFQKLREWDYLAAQRPDVVLANSHNAARRVAKYYKRKAIVIQPGIPLDKYKIKEPEDYFLFVSRLEPHKKADLAVEAFKNLPYKLKIAGTGSELDKLKKQAAGAKNIEFLGYVADEELVDLYAKCLALIFPQEEDFGLVPVEAQASGRPVIAYGRGGALETVKNGETGLFFYPHTAKALAETVKIFNATKFDSKVIRAWAENFSESAFKQKFKDIVEAEWKKICQNSR